MDNVNDPKRREQVAANARRQLAEKTWPQVMAVFQYENPRAERKPSEEVDRLKKALEDAGCTNMATFLEMARLEERQRNVIVSYNFSMRWRTSPGDAEVNAKNVASFFGCPDILVGTRNGIEGSMDWFSNVCGAIPMFVPESLQVMDKIFGEALEALKGGSASLTLGDMFKVATGETNPPKPDVPSKH